MNKKNANRADIDFSEADKYEGNAENQPVEQQATREDPDDDDIAFYMRSHLKDSEKIDALSKIKNPPLHFKFLAVTRGSKAHNFSYHWLGDFDWLIYSISESGVFCKFCSFFAVGDNIGSFLVKLPFKNFQKCRKSFLNHSKTS